MPTYRRSDNLEFVGYLDSDFAGCVDSSISRCIFMLAEGPVSWSSAKQSLVTTFIMEAEFISYFE